MPDWSWLRFGEGGIAAAAAGILLLLLGRKLYWVFVGLAGFVAGFLLAETLLETSSEWLALLAGLLFGAVAALLAVFFQKLAVALAGFVVAFIAVLWWASGTGWDPGFWLWVVAGLAGFLGAMLTRWLFELALIVFSSLLGAVLIVRAISWETDHAGLATFALASLGIAIQAWSGRRVERARRSREE